MAVWTGLKRIARRLPWVRDLYRYILQLEGERDSLRAEVGHWKTWMSPGHYYSPVPSLDEIRKREQQLFASPPPTLPAIDLRPGEQLALVAELAGYYDELPFARQKSEKRRYWFENPAYSYADAIYLYSFIRHLRPKRIIEIGSGFSSAAMLDTSELFLDNSVTFTFIDPDPSTLRTLLRPGDKPEIIGLPVQDVTLKRFEALEANDILFVDSTHVSKTGSDVNRIVFEILPALRSGVYVHFHDVFYPFEYPKEWVYEGRAWNEDYLLRAFLEYNQAFDIVLFGTWLARFHQDVLRRSMPLCLENPGGSLWLRKK